MPWIAIPGNDNWEYSNDPNTDKQSNNSYDYDAFSGHVDGVRENEDGSKCYVLCRQVEANVSCPVGYGELNYVEPEIPPEPETVELLSNGDNEAGLFYLDDVEDDLVSGCTRELSTDVVHSGTNSAKLIGSGSFGYRMNDSDESIIPNGITVTLSGYIFIPSDNVSLDNVGIFDYITGTYIEDSLNTFDEWVYFEYDIVVTAGFSIMFMGQSATSGDYFYLDDLSLTMPVV